MNFSTAMLPMKHFPAQIFRWKWTNLTFNTNCHWKLVLLQNMIVRQLCNMGIPLSITHTVGYLHGHYNLGASYSVSVGNWKDLLQNEVGRPQKTFYRGCRSASSPCPASASKKKYMETNFWVLHLFSNNMISTSDYFAYHGNKPKSKATKKQIIISSFLSIYPSILAEMAVLSIVYRHGLIVGKSKA